MLDREMEERGIYFPELEEIRRANSDEGRDIDDFTVFEED